MVGWVEKGGVPANWTLPPRLRTEEWQQKPARLAQERALQDKHSDRGWKQLQQGTTQAMNSLGAALLLPLLCGNDPSAGSPTETLLRLHLPLNDEV